MTFSPPLTDEQIRESLCVTDAEWDRWEAERDALIARRRAERKTPEQVPWPRQRIKLTGPIALHAPLPLDEVERRMDALGDAFWEALDDKANGRPYDADALTLDRQTAFVCLIFDAVGVGHREVVA